MGVKSIDSSLIDISVFSTLICVLKYCVHNYHDSNFFYFLLSTWCGCNNDRLIRQLRFIYETCYFQMNASVIVKLFATANDVTETNLSICLSWLAGILMNTNNYALIGQPTLPSSNEALCSSVILSSAITYNYITGCSTGYQRASPSEYFFCLKGIISID